MRISSSLWLHVSSSLTRSSSLRELITCRSGSFHSWSSRHRRLALRLLLALGGGISRVVDTDAALGLRQHVVEARLDAGDGAGEEGAPFRAFARSSHDAGRDAGARAVLRGAVDGLVVSGKSSVRGRS